MCLGRVQIEFLEVRLSEVMAYADIPPSMRPALTEYDPVSLIIGKDAAAGGGGGSGGGGGLAGIRGAQVEGLRASILKSLAMLREVRQSLCEWRAVGSLAATVSGVEHQIPFGCHHKASPM